jgi:predicted TIM-barrel fold metal-dependent hydrolase
VKAGEGKAGLVDAHVHVAVLGRRPEEGFASPRMHRSLLGRGIRRWLGVRSDDPGELSGAYAARLEAALAASRTVRAAVVLALDGVYDASGRVDFDRTHLYVPNDYVLALARRNPALLAGASVHPARRDALDELARVAEAGAVLVKWLPNSQLIDPADPAHLPFYRQLARRGLPLLVHSGVEFSVRAAAQHLGDPARWRPALEEGVTVIAAHGGSSGLVLWERHAGTFFGLLERYPRLYADSSALVMPNRAGMLFRLARAGWLDRLTFGTDYPLPCFPSLLLARLRPAAWRAVRRERNYFDRQVRLFRALGWEPSSAVLERLLARRG